MKVVITGGSGRAGQYIIPELVTHGYDVVNADITEGPDQGAHWYKTEAADLVRSRRVCPTALTRRQPAVC